MSDIEKLLKPRFKLIASYPECQEEVGFIYDSNNKTWSRLWFDMMAKYPHLFKPLAWWEDREEAEMPQYVKILKDGSYTRLDGDVYDEKSKEVDVVFPPAGTILKCSSEYRWCKLSTTMYLISEKNEWVEIHAELLTPATEQEYQSYIKQKV